MKRKMPSLLLSTENLITLAPKALKKRQEGSLQKAILCGTTSYKSSKMTGNL
jgi:hypothetical protein